MRRTIIITVLLISAIPAMAQQTYPAMKKPVALDTDTTKKGDITVIADNRIHDMVKEHIREKKEKGTIEGFRIQLMAGTARAPIYERKAEFYKIFPDYKSYVVYHQPFFKLRVGDYLSRLEAYRLLKEISAHEEFKDAFIVRDDLKVSEFHK